LYTAHISIRLQVLDQNMSLDVPRLARRQTGHTDFLLKCGSDGIYEEGFMAQLTWLDAVQQQK
jgi:hypothetical protein